MPLIVADLPEGLNVAAPHSSPAWRKSFDLAGGFAAMPQIEGVAAPRGSRRALASADPARLDRRFDGAPA